MVWIIVSNCHIHFDCMQEIMLRHENQMRYSARLTTLYHFSFYQTYQQVLHFLPTTDYAASKKVGYYKKAQGENPGQNSYF